MLSASLNKTFPSFVLGGMIIVIKLLIIIGSNCQSRTVQDKALSKSVAYSYHGALSISNSEKELCVRVHDPFYYLSMQNLPHLNI